MDASPTSRKYPLPKNQAPIHGGKSQEILSRKHQSTKPTRRNASQRRSDALKLSGSEFSERKAVVVYGFEHEPPEIPLETTIEAFELIAREVRGIDLGPRAESKETGLVHPVHEQVRTCGWEVQG